MLVRLCLLLPALGLAACEDCVAITCADAVTIDLDAGGDVPAGVYAIELVGDDVVQCSLEVNEKGNIVSRDCGTRVCEVTLGRTDISVRCVEPIGDEVALDVALDDVTLLSEVIELDYRTYDASSCVSGCASAEATVDLL